MLRKSPDRGIDKNFKPYNFILFTVWLIEAIAGMCNF